MSEGSIVMPSLADALPGRSEPMVISGKHYVSGKSMLPPFPDEMEVILLGMGCFWGVERLFWDIPGVVVTAVGYGGGYTPNPTYEEVCSGLTGHAELVKVVYDPNVVTLNALLEVFWDNHDPTQLNRQGADIGTQYRSCLFVNSEPSLLAARASLHAFDERLTGEGFGSIHTEVALDNQFYYAEEYHQQYLAKNPGGYCGLKGTGVKCVL